MIRWAAFFLLLTTNAQSPETESPPSYDYFFLQDILRKISDIEQWRLDRVRLSSLDVKNAKISAAQRYEFILQIGGNSLALKFNDERLSWEKLHRKSKQASKGSDIFEPQMVKIMQRRPSLKPFKLEGPLEMHIHGSGEPQLILPLNPTLIAPKRVLVGEGITIRVKGAQQITLIHPSISDSFINRTSINVCKTTPLAVMYYSCMPRLLVRISEPISLIAYGIRNAQAHMNMAFPSNDTLTLMLENGILHWSKSTMRQPIVSLDPGFLPLNSKLDQLRELLKRLLGERIYKMGKLRISRVRIIASTLVRFQLELKRDMREELSDVDASMAWRTRPTLERAWFEIVARAERGEQLKPLILKRLRPFVRADSRAWSNLMGNTSLARFPSSHVPSEALTLDVKW